jgi:DNA mismatch repair ATPase MutS
MKAFLMYRNRDFDMQKELPRKYSDLVNDLEMEPLIKEMSAGDAFLYDVIRRSVLMSLQHPEEIVYRQKILGDCLKRSATVKEIYLLAVEAIEREKKVWGSVFGRYPDGLLHRSVEVLEIFIVLLKRLRHVADSANAEFNSEGFTRFFAMISEELNDDYMATVEGHLKRLKFKDGIRISAELGNGNKGTGYILRMPAEIRHGWRDRLHRWMEQLSLGGKQPRLAYQIAERDESGLRALSELKGRGISQVAVALAQSTDHILIFFKTLRVELGFYIGCINLRDRLTGKDEPICFPEPVTSSHVIFVTRGLYDVSLSLSLSERVVGNDVNANDKPLVVITGANRGGKSTLLRSIGLSQLMMQCGMFVPATHFQASLCNGIFTHFKREEDPSMKSGKLDEELSRMSAIADQLSAGSLMLFNESFASTNEREGSEIARQIVRALIETGVRMLYVTHMFDLADSLYRAEMAGALFLRAERLASGVRTFRLVEANPLPTSYGEDLYRQIFEDGHLQN